MKDSRYGVSFRVYRRPESSVWWGEIRDKNDTTRSPLRFTTQTNIKKDALQITRQKIDEIYSLCLTVSTAPKIEREPKNEVMTVEKLFTQFLKICECQVDMMDKSPERKRIAKNGILQLNKLDWNQWELPAARTTDDQTR